MGLFQKNPFSTTQSKSLYTLGLSKTVLVVGLGNTGKQYQKTRHNAGFMAVEAFAKAHNMAWINKRDMKAELAIGDVGDTRVILCKPTTMMNSSGHAAQATANFYKINPSDIVAVYDEIEISFGKIRCRNGGSSAGHNGVKNLISHLGQGFGRVRIGIGPKQPPQIDSADFVLANFSKDQLLHLSDMGREVTAMLTEFVSSGQLPHDTRSFIA